MADPKNPPPKNLLDRIIRRFQKAAYMLAILWLYSLGALALGVALAPAIGFTQWLMPMIADWQVGWRLPAAGTILGLAFFVFGFALIGIVPVFNILLPTRVKPFKGGYFTVWALPWYLHNGLFYLVRFTFLPFITLTPFGLWFLRAMGMKMGRHVFVNTEYISDPRLITLGHHAVLGGSVRIFAHYGGGGHLVIAPVEIGDHATIGLGAVVMGDVKVGAHAVVLPHSVLLPGSRVGEGETWGGVPARRITREEMELFKKGIRGLSDEGLEQNGGA